jgi:hypothetical protein
MSVPGGAPVGDFLLALGAFAWTTWLFRLRGNRAVARQTRIAMEVTPVTQGELAGRDADLWRVARGVWRAKRAWPGKPMCLQTSLVMQEVLRRRGIESALHVGVDKVDDLVQAHAWVVAGDYAIDDSRLHSRFLKLPRPGVPDEAVVG